MGHDGRGGAKVLRDAGAEMLAQDEATSVVWGMPGAVVGAGLADEVLPLDRDRRRPGPARLTGRAVRPTVVADDAVRSRTSRSSRQLVRREASIVLAPGKEYLVEARLIPVARQVGAASVAEFLADLQRRPNAADQRQIIDALTTNETSWFRDREPFTALTDVVLPELVAVAGGHPPGAGLVGGQLQRAGGVQPGDHAAGEPAAGLVVRDHRQRHLHRDDQAGRGGRVQPGRGQPRPAGQPAGAVLRAGRRALAGHARRCGATSRSS